MSINRVIVTGNLTRDPELRNTNTGLPVLSFSIAVNDRRKNNQTGEWQDYPNYIDCTLFGTRAEGVAKYISKGSKVAIEGKLRWSQWEKDGQKRSKIEIMIDEIEFLSRSNTSDNSQGNNYAPQPQTPPQSVSSGVYDEEIPF